jgi:transcription initiation factor TFIIIB Brf1 subunit/transcription initiation factor TFIIB
MDNTNEFIWNQALLSKKTTEIDKQLPLLCKNCDSTYIVYDRGSDICTDCGFVVNNSVEYSSYSFEDTPDTYKKNAGNFSKQYSKLSKIQEWMNWSNLEKNEYKLKQYVKEFCEQLHIHNNIIEQVINLVVKVMNSIKDKNDGPKRSRVKNGIIISCIYYTAKENNLQLNYFDLAKKINLDIKYVSKGDKILMSLNFLDSSIINKTEQPIDYVNSIVTKFSLNNQIKDIEIIVKNTLMLINICQDNDLLLDHTPQSIGCSCFYYIIYKTNIDINLKLFSQMFNISHVTITKAFNKLKILEEKIDKLLQ